MLADAVALGELPPAARDSLVRPSWLLRGSRVATACFVLPTGPTYVDGPSDSLEPRAPVAATYDCKTADPDLAGAGIRWWTRDQRL